MHGNHLQGHDQALYEKAGITPRSPRGFDDARQVCSSVTWGQPFVTCGGPIYRLMVHACVSSNIAQSIQNILITVIPRVVSIPWLAVSGTPFSGVRYVSVCDSPIGLSYFPILRSLSA